MPQQIRYLEKAAGGVGNVGRANNTPPDWAASGKKRKTREQGRSGISSKNTINERLRAPYEQGRKGGLAGERRRRPSRLVREERRN